jgi:predicted AAA+ superfamily ATPase
MNHERPLVDVLRKALNKRPGFMHVVVGPRQVGKTTPVGVRSSAGGRRRCGKRSGREGCRLQG